MEEDIEAMEDLEEDSDHRAPLKTITKEATVAEDTLEATVFSKAEEDNKEDSVRARRSVTSVATLDVGQRSIRSKISKLRTTDTVNRPNITCTKR